MYKFLFVLALAIIAVSAIEKAPEAPKDLDTANQLLYTHGAYPYAYSAGLYGYGGYPAYGGHYGGYRAYSPYGLYY